MLFRSLLERVMELFPLIDKPLFPDWRYYEEWQRRFIKKYPAKKKWCGRKQGKAPVWAIVEYGNGNILEITGRATVNNKLLNKNGNE